MAASHFQPASGSSTAISEGSFLATDTMHALQELQNFAAELSQTGASIKAVNMAASPHMLRNKGYALDIVRVGAALYGQQETVPGTRSAARWLSRIVSLKKVSILERHGARRSICSLALTALLSCLPAARGAVFTCVSRCARQQALQEQTCFLLQAVLSCSGHIICSPISISVPPCSCQTDCSKSQLYQEHMRCARTQVAEGDVLHDGHRAKADMEVAVIYHGYTDA